MLMHMKGYIGEPHYSAMKGKPHYKYAHNIYHKQYPLLSAIRSPPQHAQV